MSPQRKRPIDLERTSVVSLTRFTGGDDERWSCTLCGMQHAASDSWSLAFDTVRGPRTAVICEDCAVEVPEHRVPSPEGEPRKQARSS